MTTKTTTKAEEITLPNGEKVYKSIHIDGNNRVGVRYSLKPNRDRFLEMYELKSGNINIWAAAEDIIKNKLKDPADIKDIKYHKNDVLKYSITVSPERLKDNTSKPKQEEPKADTPKQEEPKKEEPKTNAPQTSRKGNKKGQAQTKKK